MQGIGRGIESRVDNGGFGKLLREFFWLRGLMDQASPLEFLENRLHSLELNFVFLGHGTAHICNRLF